MGPPAACPEIVVLGSANMDLVMDVPRLPAPGETLQGRRAGLFPGGKGANQAIGAARLGAGTSFCGKVGQDPFGRALLHALRDAAVDADAVRIEDKVATGVACVFVTPSGENAIAVSPGANDRVDKHYVETILERIATARILLVQLEIPIATVGHLLRRLPLKRPRVILDPSPAQDLSALPLARVDILTPNRGELAALAGCSDPKVGGRRLIAEGVGDVICKAGGDGAYWIAEERIVHLPAVPIEPVDTTGAGDAFNAALAWALRSMSIGHALSWAVAAGAFAATRRGAQPSLPTYLELEAFREATAAG
jgi:ribokinase